MKILKRSLVFLCILFFLGTSYALAIPKLPQGGVFIQFAGVEQISPTGSIVAPSGNLESSWGIFRVSSITDSDPVVLDPSDQNFQQGTTSYYSLGQDDGYITGIFFGLQLVVDPNNSTLLLSSGGEIHFYYQTTATAPSLASALPGQRTADDQFTGFTTGTFLGAAEFLDGAILPGASVVGDAIPTLNGFSGFANSFGNIKDMNGDGVIDDLDGVWAQQLSTAFFNTALGNNTADLKFRNIYESDGPHYWNDLTDPDNPILGAQMTDPLRAVNAVPEPGTMLLLGAGLLGLAAYGRKRYMKS